MSARVHPPALPHGELDELFPDVFFLTGTIKMAGPMPVRFSRNMVVVREGKSLTIINSIRLDEAGLQALEKLGKVENVVRIAGFHGIDDPFYKERYGAKVWALKSHRYVAGFDGKSEPYFEPDVEFDATTELPIRGAKLFMFATKPAEGLVLLDREGGILVSGDCLQNWATTDRYFSLVGKIALKLMGFVKPFNLGPGWLKAVKPSSHEVKSLLNLTFDHVLPAHGAPAIGNAKASYRPVIEALP